jgi:hypothetical protein
MKRWTLRILLAMLAVAALLYVGDWGAFRVRGGPVGVIQVNQLLATPLKGNKMEYDFMGVVPVSCSRSIFPQKGNPACWWVERHKMQWE